MSDRPYIFGTAASVGLAFFYFLVSSLLGGVDSALDTFFKLWYLFIPLIVGFGIQVGLFFHLTDIKRKMPRGQIAASSGTSAASMVACCAHHAADLLPFLGISALGAFLASYQAPFLLIAILSNALGAVYMTSLIRKHKFTGAYKQSFFGILGFGAVIIVASFLYQPAIPTAAAAPKGLAMLANSQNSVDFSITPMSASEFSIAINTHSVELGFDLTQVSSLQDDQGNIYKAARWEGSPPGGHHRTGTLIFEPVRKDAKYIKLTITDSAVREFQWQLR